MANNFNHLVGSGNEREGNAMLDQALIKAQLERKLSELTARVESIDSDLSVPVNEDWEERATETEGDEVLAGVGSLALNEIEQIKLALRKIDAGTYGKCSRCGKTIPAQRLELLPFATTCIHCV
jgi:DnaK suppressor protein